MVVKVHGYILVLYHLCLCISVSLSVGVVCVGLLHCIVLVLFILSLMSSCSGCRRSVVGEGLSSEHPCQLSHMRCSRCWSGSRRGRGGGGDRHKEEREEAVSSGDLGTRVVLD